MTFFINSHGGTGAKANVQKREVFAHEALVPSDGDIAVDEAADFGFLLPPTGDGCTTLPDTAVGDLDQLINDAGAVLVGNYYNETVERLKAASKTRKVLDLTRLHRDLVSDGGYQGICW